MRANYARQSLHRFALTWTKAARWQRNAPKHHSDDRNRNPKRRIEMSNATTEATTNNVRLLQTGSRDNYFGVCPICRRQDGYLNNGHDHWFKCDTHRTKWCVGSNLFSSWRFMTPEESFAQVDRLAGYREVEPFNIEKHGTADEMAAYRAAIAEVTERRARFKEEIEAVVEPLHRTHLLNCEGSDAITADADADIPF
jgi:hypothetical protein